MIEALLDLAVPLIVADIIDIGIAEGDQSFITARFVFLIIIALAGLACSVVAQYFAARAAPCLQTSAMYHAIKL